MLKILSHQWQQTVVPSKTQKRFKESKHTLFGKSCNCLHILSNILDLPSTRLTPCVQRVPRVLSQCDLCGPPLQTIVLEEEDWNNLKAWFSHLWPPASKGNTHTLTDNTSNHNDWSRKVS